MLVWDGTVAIAPRVCLGWYSSSYCTQSSFWLALAPHRRARSHAIRAGPSAEQPTSYSYCTEKARPIGVRHISLLALQKQSLTTSCTSTTRPAALARLNRPDSGTTLRNRKNTQHEFIALPCYCAPAATGLGRTLRRTLCKIKMESRGYRRLRSETVSVLEWSRCRCRQHRRRCEVL